MVEDDKRLVDGFVYDALMGVARAALAARNAQCTCGSNEEPHEAHCACSVADDALYAKLDEADVKRVLLDGSAARALRRSAAKLSDARVAELRAYRLIREMEDEIACHDRNRALRNPLHFALSEGLRKTGRDAEDLATRYERARAKVRDRREILERRIARVRVLAGLPSAREES